MTWVNAFITARNSHRDVSVGGRRANNQVEAWLNLQTCAGCVDMTVSGYVSGTTTARERRRHEDTRMARFVIKVPSLSQYAETIISNSDFRDLEKVFLGDRSLYYLVECTNKLEEIRKAEASNGECLIVRRRRRLLSLIE